MKQILLSGLVLMMVMSASAQHKTFDEMAKEVSKGHEISMINAETLRNKIQHNRKLLILDTRTKKEFNVSHIRGARYVGYDNFEEASVKDIINHHATVIVYCSVGKRSGDIGDKLYDMGYDEVYNLYGGIFSWVNQGYSLVNKEDKVTKKIHGYTKEWGKWIKSKKVEVIY